MSDYDHRAAAERAIRERQHLLHELEPWHEVERELGQRESAARSIRKISYFGGFITFRYAAAAFSGEARWYKPLAIGVVSVALFVAGSEIAPWVDD
jgi:hypothetical protein